MHWDILNLPISLKPSEHRVKLAFGELKVLNVSLDKDFILVVRGSNRLTLTEPIHIWVPVLNVSFVLNISSSCSQTNLRLVCVAIVSSESEPNKTPPSVRYSKLPFNDNPYFPVLPKEISRAEISHLISCIYSMVEGKDVHCILTCTMYLLSHLYWDILTHVLKILEI